MKSKIFAVIIIMGIFSGSKADPVASGYDWQSYQKIDDQNSKMQIDGQLNLAEELKKQSEIVEELKKQLQATENRKRALEALVGYELAFDTPCGHSAK